MKRRSAFWLVILACIALGTSAYAADTVKVRFVSNDALLLVERTVPSGMAPVEAAVRALVAGPTQAELVIGVTSSIPAGTAINKLSLTDTSAAIDMSSQVVVGLTEARLTAIFDQFRATLDDFPPISTIRLTCNGKLLSSYLSAAPEVGQAALIATQSISGSSVGLAGRKIGIGPSHGRYWNATYGWLYQRGDPCGLGDACVEDTNSIRLMQFLNTYLQADGATVEVPRQLDESDCCNSDTGMPWWKMCASSWLHHIGAPGSVWASSSGNTGADTAADRSSDDVRARPLWADYKGTDIYIACHTNAGGGGTATGTVTYRDTAMEHPTWVGASLTLATSVQNAVCSAIRDIYDPNWYIARGVQDSAGNFGEIRIPNRPACLIELAFHDNCSLDAAYLTDDFFRSTSEWGLYNGICAYFGTTPTWGKYSCEYVGDTIPSVMTAGQSYTVTVTLRNRGVCWFSSRAFRLGTPSGTDPFASFSRVDVAGEVKPGQNYTFSFVLKAPTNPGTYTTNWQMVRDGYQWFGPAISKQIAVGNGVIEPPDITGSALPAKTFDWQNGVPTYMSGGWVSTSTCGYPEWYTYTESSACVNFNRDAKWQSSQSYPGRGHWATDVQVPCNYATVNTRYALMKPDGTDEGTTVWLDQCPRDGWYSLLETDKQDLSVGGWRINTTDTTAAVTGGCNATCGNKKLGAAGLHMYGDRWQYINDWACLGAYSSAAVSETHGFDEASLYLYPAIDRTHGDVFTWNGRAPGRVTTGDCNNANSLNFKGNAAAYGGDNVDAYALAWMYAPAGAAPKFVIGSDDGNRVWVNGTIINDNNSSRGLVRDQDESPSIALPGGWTRVLFKVHNGALGFEGTVSLRNGGNKSWNETSVNAFDLGGYLTYGLGYEQDSWYPRIEVATFDGSSNPQPGAQVFTNNSTVTANGTAWTTGPVPLWKVMHYESGFGLTGETNYTDVSSSGATWSHTETGVVGHRRLSFFSVSQSHRTSFQSGPNSGKNGGSNWADGGPANYMDVYVDNISPLSASFSDLTAESPNSINLNWALPLDQGVGVPPGADEYASTGGDNAYRRGDVGVSARRNGAVVYAWGTSTSFTDTGLTANTQYVYDIAARDNTSRSRGAWNNSMPYGGVVSRWTLSIPASAANVTCDKTSGETQTTAGFTFTAVGGFGPGKLDHYLYSWDKNPTHAFTGSESSWNSGALVRTASSEGEWYLHVQSINGEGVANGTLDLGPYRYSTARTVDSIGLAFAQADSASLALKGKPVTAALPGMFWIEEPDRTAALKVISGATVAAGDLVDVAGSLGLSGVQRVLVADIVTDLGAGTIPAPAFLTVRSLGGSSLNPATPGVSTARGLYNIGMLVRIAGKVSFVSTTDPLAKFFYLDDGIGLIDDSGNLGVKVLCGAIDPPTAATVIVTGIVSSEQTGAKIVPTLIIRNAGDVRPL